MDLMLILIICLICKFALIRLKSKRDKRKTYKHTLAANLLGQWVYGVRWNLRKAED